MPHIQHKVQSMSAVFRRREFTVTILDIRFYQTASNLINPTATAFHAVNSGSNPLGDAKFRYKEECQGPKDLGILCFFFPVWFPKVQLRPLASKHFMGISVGRNVVRHF